MFSVERDSDNDGFTVRVGNDEFFCRTERAVIALLRETLGMRPLGRPKGVDKPE